MTPLLCAWCGYGIDPHLLPFADTGPNFCPGFVPGSISFEPMPSPSATAAPDPEA